MVRTALPLAKRPRKSWWDVHAPGYEGISAEQLKLSGEVTPGAPVPDKLPPRLLEIVTLPELDPAGSSTIRKIICGGDRAEVVVYLEAFGPVEGSGNEYLMASPKAAAEALATPGPFAFRRPERVVSSLQGDIYTNTNTWYGVSETKADQVVELTGGRLFLNPENKEGLTPLFDKNYGQPILSKQLDRMIKQAGDKVPAPPTSDLLVYNAVLHSDQSEASKICAEIEHACRKYGEVVNVSYTAPAGMLGRIEVGFSSHEGCQRALDGLGGIEFDGRPLICAFK